MGVMQVFSACGCISEFRGRIETNNNTKTITVTKDDVAPKAKTFHI